MTVDKDDFADWRRYFSETQVTDEEIAALDDLATIWADHTVFDMLDAYRRGREDERRASKPEPADEAAGE